MKIYGLIFIFVWVLSGMIMSKIEGDWHDTYFSRPVFEWYDVLVNLALGPIKLVCYLISIWI